MEQKSKSIVAAIVVAAGAGTRIGGDIPKQFIDIGGKPILRHTLEKIAACERIDFIYVILPPEYTVEYETIIRDQWRIKKFSQAIPGGNVRHLSVWAGLQALDNRVDIVMIHDGVRPFVTQRILLDSIRAAEETGAAVVGLMPKDTVKLVDSDKAKTTLDRWQLLLAQTPQTFRKELIMRANKRAFTQDCFSTDDAALVEQMGRDVAIVQGDWRNIKITSPEDLVIAKAFLQEELCE